MTLVDRGTEFGDAVDEKAVGGEGSQQRLDLGRVIERKINQCRWPGSRKGLSCGRCSPLEQRSSQRSSTRTIRTAVQ
ncbi:MAG: hypothetical protein WBM78_05720, partial [Desulfobacterales bacterium]